MRPLCTFAPQLICPEAIDKKSRAKTEVTGLSIRSGQTKFGAKLFLVAFPVQKKYLSKTCFLTVFGPPRGCYCSSILTTGNAFQIQSLGDYRTMVSVASVVCLPVCVRFRLSSYYYIHHHVLFQPEIFAAPFY